MHRRTFIYSAAAFTAIAAGLLRTTQVIAAPWPKTAFRRSAPVDEILEALYGTSNAQASDAITLEAPLNAADGANVPVKVAATLPDVESIALISHKNPVPLLTQLHLKNAAPFYSVRVKLGETTQLSAYVRSHGQLYVASRTVKVAVGGCGDAVNEERAGAPASYPTRMRIRSKGAYTETLVLVKHPMETGARKDTQSGQVIPEHFIRTMVFSRNGEIVAEADMGIGVSRNPLITIALDDAAPGDRIGLHWVDNQGNSGSADNVVA